MLRAARGYHFQSLGRGQVALMRAGTKGPTVTCECSTTSGCKITIDPEDPQSISCLESGCSGSCGWVISVPGLAGFRFQALAARR